MKFDANLIDKVYGKIVDYAHGTATSYGGDVHDGSECLILAAFSVHAAYMAASGKKLEEGLMDMTQHMAALYPQIYRVAADAARKKVGG